MSMIGFPLLLIPLAIYNILVFLMPGLSLGAPLVGVPLLSHARWQLTFSDVLLALAMLMVTFEIVKSSRPGAKYLTDHLLSFAVLCGAVAEFLMLSPFATSTFFLLTVLAAVEFVASMTVAWRREVQTVPAAAPVQEVGPQPELDHEPPATSPIGGHEVIWEKLPSQPGTVPGAMTAETVPAATAALPAADSLASGHSGSAESHLVADEPSHAKDNDMLPTDSIKS